MAVFRVERTKGFTVMSNYHLNDKTISLKAKGLLSQMLSLPESWDFTLRGLACINKESLDAIRTAVLELEEHGYITRRQKRGENGKLSKIEYTIYEQPQQKQPLSPRLENPNTVPQPRLEKPCLENPNTVNPNTALPHTGNPTQLNTKEAITEKSITDPETIHQSIRPASSEPVPADDRIDRIDTIKAYREIIKENIEYEHLVKQYGHERMDELVELMLETVLAQRPYIRIAGDDYPREVVKSRFLKVNSSHVEYVFGCLDNNTTKVRNIKAYLLSALYNAPATMDSYYRAEVNHDLYG